MSDRLVFKPSVHVIAASVMLPAQLEEWANASGLTPLLGQDSALKGMYGAITDEYEERGEHGFLGSNSLDRIAEFSGRHCYRSWEKGREIGPYLDNIVESGHGSVLRHATVVLAISGISRTLSHELVRHHIGADVSQESQRYVDANEMRFVVPPLLVKMSEDLRTDHLLTRFETKCRRDVDEYKRWQTEYFVYLNDQGSTIDKKRVNEAARAVLPNACETRMVWTMNCNSARNVIAQRGAEGADLEIRRLAYEFADVFKFHAPNTFADFEKIIGEDGFPAVTCKHPKV